MVGQAPTNSLTSGGVPIAGGGFGNKTFSREGFIGIFYLKKLDFQVVTQHGSDDAYFGTATEVGGPTPLPAGARSAVWNGGIRRDPLRIQPAADFHSAVGVDTNVAAVDSGNAVEPGQHRQLRDRVPLHALHEQSRRLCLAQRVFLDSSTWNRAGWHPTLPAAV